MWSQGCNAHMEQFMRIKSFYLVYKARPALSVSLFSSVSLTVCLAVGIGWLSLGAETSLVIHAQNAPS